MAVSAVTPASAAGTRGRATDAELLAVIQHLDATGNLSAEDRALLRSRPDIDRRVSDPTASEIMVSAGVPWQVSGPRLGLGTDSATGGNWCRSVTVTKIGRSTLGFTTYKFDGRQIVLVGPMRYGVGDDLANRPTRQAGHVMTARSSHDNVRADVTQDDLCRPADLLVHRPPDLVPAHVARRGVALVAADVDMELGRAQGHRRVGARQRPRHGQSAALGHQPPLAETG